MIQTIDITENAGNSLPKINSNIEELDALVCNLQKKNIAWHDAIDVWNEHFDSWDNMATTVTELSAKWDDMSNVVFSLSSYWNGTITFVYPKPFVEGTQNPKPIQDFLTNYHPPKLYNKDQHVSVFFFIQNFKEKPTPKDNIFQKSVSSVCFMNDGKNWNQVECGRLENCLTDNCGDLFEVIDVNNQYSCMQKSEILYYLINS